MATIYDKNGDICGIVVKGNSNDNIETTDSSLSGNWNKFINCNIFKNTDTDVGYYLPLSFNEHNFDNTKPSNYFTYYITGFSYSDIANNSNTLDGNRCWFNYYDLMTWMNENNKWNSFWTDDQLSRGYNYISSYHGAHPENTTFICYACKNQSYFIKPGIKHNADSYDIIYHYYNSSKQINENAANLYATTMANTTSSTDVTVTASCIQRFKLGYNGILSGYGLTKYIESVDTTDPSGRPFWQRFFWVALKGGFNSSESYASTGKANVKVCTFDQHTGLENALYSNLTSIPLKYKKLRNDVYLVQDDHYKTFQTYSDTNKYIIQRTDSHGSVSYYNGAPYTFDQSSWTADKTRATQFNTYEEPSWWNSLEAYCSMTNSYANITGSTNYYSVKLSLPLVMNGYNGNITMDRTIYITGANGTVYTGTNVVDDYVSGKFTNAINVFCSGSHSDSRFETNLKYYNKTDASWSVYANEGSKLSNQELTYLLNGYKYILYFNDGEYWVSGNTWSNVEWTSNLNNAHVFNTYSDAQAQQEACQMQTEISIIDNNRTGFYHVLNYYYLNATMFSSYDDASDMITKMNQGGPGGNNDYEYNPGICDYSFQTYYTMYATNNNSTNTTSSVNMSDIPETRWLSLNYFFTPV